jgi:hypothetical protein
MSAFVVSKAHIDCLVHAFVTDKYAPAFVDADKLGAMLWTENYRSVNYRYPDRDASVPAYTYRPSRITDPVAVLKQIACYEYQACERPDWETSEAFKLCARLRTIAINRLPGYEAAAWGV